MDNFPQGKSPILIETRQADEETWIDSFIHVVDECLEADKRGAVPRERAA